MYQIHGFNCQVFGLPKSQIQSYLKRLEQKYDKYLFENRSDGFDVIFILTFHVVNNRYKISFDVEYQTLLPPLKLPKKSIADLMYDFQNLKKKEEPLYRFY